MADTVQMNVNIRPETRERLEQISVKTYRGLGQTVDFVVAKVYQEMFFVSVETVQNNHSVFDAGKPAGEPE